MRAGGRRRIAVFATSWGSEMGRAPDRGSGGLRVLSRGTPGHGPAPQFQTPAEDHCPEQRDPGPLLCGSDAHGQAAAWCFSISSIVRPSSATTCSSGIPGLRFSHSRPLAAARSSASVTGSSSQGARARVRGSSRQCGGGLRGLPKRDPRTRACPTGWGGGCASWLTAGRLRRGPGRGGRGRRRR